MLRQWMAYVFITLAVGFFSQQPEATTAPTLKGVDASLFVGTYNGTFSGDDSGTLTLMIDASGTLRGVGTPADDDQFGINGSITQIANNTAMFSGQTTSQATFTGTISPSGNIQGTWVNQAFGAQGTFQGMRETTPPPPVMSGIFREGWEDVAPGVYIPDADPNDSTRLLADTGMWLLDDTVSNFPECGMTPQQAEIVLQGESQVLRLTSSNSNSSCADNVWVSLFTSAATFLALPINPTLSIPLRPGTRLSFVETGELKTPQSASPRCIAPPCGDTISLRFEESGGTALAYILQRAPDATPNTLHSFYREIFLDPVAGLHQRDLYADFQQIPDFNANRAGGYDIVSVTFEVDEHGTGTIDNIAIGNEAMLGLWGASEDTPPRQTDNPH